MPAEIIDVHTRSSDGIVATDIPKQITEGLLRPFGQKQLPTMLLYDERGLRLYDDITTKVPEYYLFGAEEEILKHKSHEIVRVMHHAHGGPVAGEAIVELGAGYVQIFLFLVVAAWPLHRSHSISISFSILILTLSNSDSIVLYARRPTFLPAYRASSKAMDHHRP